MGSDYERVRTIGSGSCGKVVLIKHKATGSLRALKCVPFSDINQLNGVIKEFGIVRGLTHPNIVQYHDFEVQPRPDGEPGWNACFEMDFFEEGDLDAFIAQVGSLPSSTVVTFGAHIADALQYMHSKQVMHRDIKPHNMLLSSARTTLQLSDFGLVRTTVDPRRTVAGTYFYMAPEQAGAHNGEGYTEKADVWSAGLVMAEMMAPEYMRTAFSRRHPWQACRENEEEFHDSLQKALEAHHPSKLVATIMQLLDRDPEGRLTALQLLKKLQGLQRSLTADSVGGRGVAPATPPSAGAPPVGLFEQRMPTTQALKVPEARGNNLFATTLDMGAARNNNGGVPFDPRKASIDYINEEKQAEIEALKRQLAQEREAREARESYDREGRDRELERELERERARQKEKERERERERERAKEKERAEREKAKDRERYELERKQRKREEAAANWQNAAHKVSPGRLPSYGVAHNVPSGHYSSSQQYKPAVPVQHGQVRVSNACYSSTPGYPNVNPISSPVQYPQYSGAVGGYGGGDAIVIGNDGSISGLGGYGAGGGVAMAGGYGGYSGGYSGGYGGDAVVVAGAGGYGGYGGGYGGGDAPIYV